MWSWERGSSAPASQWVFVPRPRWLVVRIVTVPFLGCEVTSKQLTNSQRCPDEQLSGPRFEESCGAMNRSYASGIEASAEAPVRSSLMSTASVKTHPGSCRVVHRIPVPGSEQRFARIVGNGKGRVHCPVG